MSSLRKRAKKSCVCTSASTSTPKDDTAGAIKTSGCVWTKDERENILVAIRKHGFMDMDSLQAAVPHKDAEQIRNCITCLWKDARRAVIENRKQRRRITDKEDDQNYIGPVDKWLEILNNHFKSMEEYKRLPFARVFLMISLYEEQPDPSECNGIDFKAMYEFLFCTLCGFPAKDLNEPTAKYVLETLSNFAGLLKARDNTKEMNLLDAFMQVQCEFKPAKDTVIEDALNLSLEESFAELLSVPGVNPFGVPTELLHRHGVLQVAKVDTETKPPLLE